MSSRAFVPLLSRDAINHPDKDLQNFSKLTADSKCDNVFLEHRLAVELQGLGLIEKVFPVFIGDADAATGEYGNYFGGGCHPKLPDVCVKAVEEKLHHHMESQALGTPLEPDRSVLSVVSAITACQGHFIEGAADATFAAAAASIAKMLTDDAVTAVSSTGVSGVGTGTAAGTTTAQTAATAAAVTPATATATASVAVTGTTAASFATVATVATPAKVPAATIATTASTTATIDPLSTPPTASPRGGTHVLKTLLASRDGQVASLLATAAEQATAIQSLQTDLQALRAKVDEAVVTAARSDLETVREALALLAHVQAVLLR